MCAARCKSLVSLTVTLASLVLLSGCGEIRHSKPNFIYMPDMVYGPGLKAGDKGVRLPVAGTVSREGNPYPLAVNEIELAGSLKNPLPRTKATLARGKVMFNTYCIVCHGAEGLGNGSVVPKYPMPPSLQSEKIRGYPDGKIYHVITRGQNLMWSYANQVAPSDRWAIIHYIRAMQRAKNPTPDDLKAYETARGK